MFFILNNSKSGMIAQQNKLDVISNNMVNSQTNGYKKLDSSFSDMFYGDLNTDGMPISGKDANLGTGVKHTGVVRNRTQGSLKITELNTDVAIDGPGYFRVTKQSGEIAYTRNGSFNVDIFGRLSDKDGNLVEVEYNEGVNPMNTGLTALNMNISKDGVLSTKDGQEIGKINLYDSVGNDAFISDGNDLFIPANENVNIIQVEGDFYQGYVEMSNVNIGDEMSDMILSQRAYQMATKGVTTADEMWSMLNNIR